MVTQITIKDDGSNLALEKAISDVGRSKVFSIMIASGWRPGDAPPRWVWWEAVRLANATQ